MNPLLTLLALIVTVAAVSLRPSMGSDFYPLYLGAELLLEGKDPYTSEASQLLMQNWLPAMNKQAVPVIAYPLPVLILFLPLALLPFTVANFLWILLALFLLLKCVSEESKQNLLLPLCFFSFYQTLWVQNVSLLWVAFTLLLFSKSASLYARGISLALLPLKPQEGLLIMLYGLWKYRKDSEVLKVCGAILVALISTSIILLPDWISCWWGVLSQYRQQTQMVHLWYFIPILLFPRIHPDLRAVGIQFFLFPLNDLYRGLLLLVGWKEIGRPQSLWIAISFASLILYPAYNTPLTLILFVAIPYLAAVIYKSRRN